MGGDTFWIGAYCIGVAQGGFLSVALVLKRTANRRATRALALLVALMSVALLLEMTERFVPSVARLVGYLNISTELACGPLIFLFLRSLVEPERSWRRSDAAHFLPLAVGVSAWLSLYLVTSLGSLDLKEAQFRAVLGGYLTFKVAYFYTYLALGLRTLSRGLRNLRGFAEGRREVGLGWLRTWLLVLAAVMAVLYATAFLNLFDVRLVLPTDQLSSLIVTALIYLIGLMVLLRPWILSARPRPRADERYADEAARLTAYLEADKPYLDSELSLAQVAEALGVAENRLSATINEGLGTGFQPLVNAYRLRRFEVLAGDQALRHLSVLDLAFEAGFNSKATFYRVFREAHGTTPASFRRAALG